MASVMKSVALEAAMSQFTVLQLFGAFDEFLTFTEKKWTQVRHSFNCVALLANKS